ncbi:MAG TPA: hypothetical protein VK824_00310 [Planctomycetota bacterium]|nr:hypothetical protein [Planctomycetota bacterium]
MKTLHALILGGLVAAAAGCRSPQDELRGLDSMWSGESLRAASLNAAIVTQATLYPYHFGIGTATLNELGRRDLGVLAAHFHDHAGTLNVHRADASPALYEGRLSTVRAALAASGIPSGQIALADAAPGGDGMESDRALHILTVRAATPSITYASGVDSAGSTVQP